MPPRYGTQDRTTAGTKGVVGRGKAKSGGRYVAPEPPSARRRQPKVPAHLDEEMRSAAGAERAPRLAARLAQASKAYERDRYEEARQILRTLAQEAPASASVRELYGLTLYRISRWREALRQFKAFHDLTGAYDQHPAMEDCHRALRQWPSVDRLWEELREASPSAELVTEGRIVAAESRADRGDVAGAIRMLEPSARKITQPKEHHLRLWYALADLYERAGELPAARDLFGRILRQDRAFFDAAERLSSLG
ncbi:MAG TPA: hypothetical protein VE990_07680 [Acidimicrobiales bacterium]|nr:hypothetical protein [Acidimicrobiales bacterium]